MVLDHKVVLYCVVFYSVLCYAIMIKAIIFYRIALHVQVGKAGNNIGHEFWRDLCEEHGVALMRVAPSVSRPLSALPFLQFCRFGITLRSFLETPHVTSKTLSQNVTT